LADDFEKVRREFLGMTQEEVLDMLGRPDMQLLLERTQKAYIYYIEPGTQCQGQKDISKARTVSFRFNAVNRATEVLYGEGKPE
jgi:tetrahydromethanopterin S-methyltransferase subunit H